MKKNIYLFLLLASYLSIKSQCDYIIDMQDTYGDGWNGALIDMYINGAIATNFTISTTQGASAQDSYSTYNGDSVEFYFNSGNWDTEITFQITAPDGSNVGSYGPFPVNTGNDQNIWSGISNATCTAPSCIDPFSVNAFPSSFSLDLSWNAGQNAASFNIDYGVSGYSFGTGNTDTSNINSKTISNLLSNTTYDFYIQSVCGANDTSAWVGPFSFSTYPSCGDSIGPYCYDYGSFTILTAESDNPNLAIEVNITAGETEIGNDYLEIYDGIGTNGNLLYSADGDHAGVSIISGTGILTMYINGSSWNCCLDGGGYIPIEATFNCVNSSCLPVNNLIANNISSTFTNLSWVAGGTETSWEIEYGAEGFNQGSGTLDTVFSNSYFLSSLTSNTGYDIYVTPLCDSGNTSTPRLLNFTTLFSCGDNFGPYCYGPGDTTILTAISSNPGDFLRIDITAGETELCCDNLQIYDDIGPNGNLLYDAAGIHTGVSVVSFTGIITLHMDGNNWWNCEDGWGGPYIPIECSFSCLPSNPVDLEMSEITTSDVIAPGNTNISGIVTNFGTNTINSFDIVWDAGSGPQTETFNISLGLGDSYNFTHNSPISTSAGQSSTISVEVIANNDANNANNALSKVLHTYSFEPDRKVVFENATISNTWLGSWSPRGIVSFEMLSMSTYKDDVEIINVHHNFGADSSNQTYDAMYYKDYADSLYNNQFVSFSGIPRYLVDRKNTGVHGGTSILLDFLSYNLDFGFADIEILTNYDSISRELTASANLEFATNYENLNLALVITEDSVHNTTDPGYMQFNAYFGGNNGPMASSSVDFETYGNPVPAVLMHYKNVARKIIPSFSGSNSALPSAVKADSLYNYTFPTYSVPPEYNEKKLRAIVLLIDPSNGRILNANGKDIFEPSTLSINELNSSYSVQVFPNPSSGKAFVKLNFDLSPGAELIMSDLSGKIVYQQSLNSSNKNRVYEINKTEINSGIYILSLKNNKTILNKKLVFD